MTKILLHLGAILLVFSLNSQNLNVAEHEAVDRTGGVVSINSKYYYLRTSEDLCCQYKLSLTGTDQYFQNIFRTYVGNKHVKNFGKLISTNDKAIVFTGFDQQSCDQTSCWEYITKLDTNGNVLFHTIVLTGSYWSPKIVGLTQHPDGSYYLIAYNFLYHCSASGQMTSTLTLDASISSVTGLLALSNGNLLINGTIGGVRKNIVISTSGTILNSQTSSGGNSKFVERSNGFYTFRSTGIIERYDSSLTLKVTSNSALASSSYTISDFTVRNDSVFVTGITGSLKKPFYALLDSSLTVLYQATLNYEGVWPSGISLNNKNKVCIVSTCNSRPTEEFSFSGIFNLGITGSLTPVLDIGVTSYTVLTSNLSVQSFSTPSMDLNVSVQNFGTDTVRSFYLNYYAFIPSCYILLHKKIDTLLNPGVSMIFNTGTFYGQPNYQGQAPNGKWNICVFTTIPNGRNDFEIDNDAFCDSIVFLPTGIKEIIKGEESITIYPNPSSSSFHLNSQNEVHSIEVYSSIGTLVSKEWINSKELELGSGWTAGVYFLRLQTSQGVVIKKLLKD